ncbi:hypothetical protein QJS10_CPB20g01495 [Acorus calamus]|uniref:Nitroreductase domain-containing protein n=1 Tax=Acorus calamus TaxID=4465 RepID=A0AAV9CDS0_ACOCL|nr:hypothetical protein QJS10_CPB20g01495 [Acorus calamus]
MSLLPSRRISFRPQPLFPFKPSTPPHKTINPKSSITTNTMHSKPPPPSTEQPPSSTATDASAAAAITYHNRTKHSPTRYARGPHGLDWSNQPNPFRRYPPSPHHPLQLPPPPQQPPSPPYPTIFHSLPSPPSPLSPTTLSHLLFHSLSLSAWKSSGPSTWSLRVNPSSGNLHPTESYVITPSSVAHYAPKAHALETRASLPSNHNPLFAHLPRPDSSLVVGFSSIFWREAWKYGERAFRYCNHDVGHAIAAVAVSAASLGWDCRLLDGLAFSDLERLLGLPGICPSEIPTGPARGRFNWVEAEHPDCALLVFPGDSGEFSLDYGLLRSAIGNTFGSVEWVGSPNSLSKDHVCWDVIYRTAEAVKKPVIEDERFYVPPFQGSLSVSESSYKGMTVAEVVRKRRSAVDLDGVHAMERETFYQILAHCLPTGGGEGEKQGKQLTLPFRVMGWDAEVHMALFVHRVAGLASGLYFLVRNEGYLNRLKRAMRAEFVWEKPEGCPDGLPLYRLVVGDCRRLSMGLSCHQDIASDGCFSLGMIARFEPVLQEKGAWMYPRLFWETGILGQVLYLEAHAVGISATGIGCYFDDAVHEVLGLKGSEFQSLYHFTVGAPVVDKRIMSLPAYPGPDIDA